MQVSSGSFASGDWQRISAIAVIYFLAKTLRHLFGQIVFLIPVFIFINKNIKENPVLTVAIIVSIGLLLGLYAVASFLVYRYRLSSDTLEIRSGIFKKTQTHLPFSRIQNIRLEQPIYYRLFNFCCMELDTAGSIQNEAKLIAIHMNQAVALKDIILSTRKSSSGGESNGERQKNESLDETIDEHILCTRSVSDLIIHGVTNNRVWLFLGAAAPFFDTIIQYLGISLSYIGLDLQKLFDVDSQGYAVVVIAALSLTMFIMMILAVFSIAGSILTYYDYRLSRNEDRYIRRSGLLTKHEVALPLRRLQMITYKQDWLDVVLGRVNLIYLQADASVGQATAANTNKLVVPSVFPEQAQSLAEDAMKAAQLSQALYSPIHKRYILNKFLVFVIPTAVLAALIIGLNNDSWLIGTAALIAISLLGSAIAYLRWRRWGYSMDDRYVYIRRGLFGIQHSCFERHKLQQISRKQSWFMRRYHLYSVKFVLASGGIKLPFINREEIKLIADQSLYIAESSGKSWM